MEARKTVKAKTIREAVEDGSLIDVTDIARKVGFPYPMFMTPFMVAKYEAQGPNGLFANVLYFADLIAGYTGFDAYGPMDYGDHFCIFEPHKEFGHVAVIVEAEKLDELGIERTTGEGYEFAM
jgi:hypothetical protein